MFVKSLGTERDWDLGMTRGTQEGASAVDFSFPNKRTEENDGGSCASVPGTMFGGVQLPGGRLKRSRSVLSGGADIGACVWGDEAREGDLGEGGGMGCGGGRCWGGRGRVGMRKNWWIGR